MKPYSTEAYKSVQWTHFTVYIPIFAVFLTLNTVKLTARLFHCQIYEISGMLTNYDFHSFQLIHRHPKYVKSPILHTAYDQIWQGSKHIRYDIISKPSHHHHVGKSGNQTI